MYKSFQINNKTKYVANPVKKVEDLASRNAAKKIYVYDKWMIFHSGICFVFVSDWKNIYLWKFSIRLKVEWETNEKFSEWE